MTTVTTHPADYRDLGRMLKDTREGMGVTLDQVAKSLRIRKLFLQALEKGDLSAIPGDVYARGYLKTYADHLGYDGADLMGRIAAGPEKIPATKYLPPDRSGNRSLTTTVILVSVLALAAAAWWQLKREKTITAIDQVEPLPEALAYLLDKGTPRIAKPLPAACADVSGDMAIELCRGGEVFWAKAYDAKPPLRSTMQLREPYPVWLPPLDPASPP